MAIFYFSSLNILNIKYVCFISCINIFCDWRFCESCPKIFYDETYSLCFTYFIVWVYIPWNFICGLILFFFLGLSWSWISWGRFVLFFAKCLGYQCSRTDLNENVCLCLGDHSNSINSITKPMGEFIILNYLEWIIFHLHLCQSLRQEILTSSVGELFSSLFIKDITFWGFLALCKSNIIYLPWVYIISCLPCSSSSKTRLWISHISLDSWSFPHCSLFWPLRISLAFLINQPCIYKISLNVSSIFFHWALNIFLIASLPRTIILYCFWIRIIYTSFSLIFPLFFFCCCCCCCCCYFLGRPRGIWRFPG